MKRLVQVLAVGTLAVGLTAASTGPVAAEETVALPTVAYSAAAYGSRANLASGAITSGPTASSSIGCTTRAPLSRSNSVTQANLPKAGTIKALTSTSASRHTASERAAVATSSSGAISLFGGALTAGAVKSSTTAKVNGAGQYSAQQSTVLTNLRLNGMAVTASPAPNTSVTLKSGSVNVARVMLNRQVKTVSADGVSASTTAVEITMLAGNPQGLPAGSVIRIAYDSAALHKIPVPVLFSGTGFATRATAANGQVISGLTAAASIPCTGGTRTANLASVTLPGVITSGTTTTTARGSYGAGTATATVRQAVASPSILAGLVTADSFVAETAATRHASGEVSLTDRSRFVGLKVQGQPGIADDVAPNTKITLSGIGTLTLHEQTRTGDRITVTMAKLVLSNPVAGLPTGSIVYIGYSSSAIVS